VRTNKILLVLAGLSLCAALVVPSLAGAAGRAATTVKIRGSNGDFHGRITSTRKGCLGGRVVKVFKQKGDHQNPKRDKVIGKDTSEKAQRNQLVGIWSVGNTGFKTGDFYAKVRRTDFCKVAYSDTIHE
jgi:hypothetical protein